MERDAFRHHWPLSLSRPARAASWVLQVVAAAALAQLSGLSLSGAPGAVHLFGEIGLEPWGRIAAGVLEVVAIVLLLLPRMGLIGAGLGLLLMAGAMGAHVGPAGIEVQDDGGLLFVMALVVALCALGVIVIRRGAMLALYQQVRGRG